MVKDTWLHGQRYLVGEALLTAAICAVMDCFFLYCLFIVKMQAKPHIILYILHFCSDVAHCLSSIALGWHSLQVVGKRIPLKFHLALYGQMRWSLLIMTNLSGFPWDLQSANSCLRQTQLVNIVDANLVSKYCWASTLFAMLPPCGTGGD